MTQALIVYYDNVKPSFILREETTIVINQHMSRKTHDTEIKVPELDMSGSGLGSDRYLIPTNKWMKKL